MACNREVELTAEDFANGTAMDFWPPTADETITTVDDWTDFVWFGNLTYANNSNCRWIIHVEPGFIADIWFPEGHELAGLACE